MSSIAIGYPDERVARLVSKATGDTMAAPFRTVALYRDGAPVSGVCLTEYTGASVMVSGAGRLIVQREFRQSLCDLVYGVLGCRRMAITVRKSNKRMLKLAPRLGFSFEGKLRRYFGTEDGMIYSLLVEEAIAARHWVPRKVAA